MTELLTMIHQIPYCLFSCLVAAAKNDTPSENLGEWVGGLFTNNCRTLLRSNLVNVSWPPCLFRLNVKKFPMHNAPNNFHSVVFACTSECNILAICRYRPSVITQLTDLWKFAFLTLLQSLNSKHLLLTIFHHHQDRSELWRVRTCGKDLTVRTIASPRFAVSVVFVLI